MPIVEPHLYADTPIFREMLYEREGRFPGTPEGEEPFPEIQLPEPQVFVPEPLPEETTQVMPLQKAVYRVTPIGPEKSTPVSLVKS